MVMVPKPAPPEPPSVGFLRQANRVIEVRVSCTSCARTVDVPLSEFKVPDDTPFPALKRLWTRPCGRCGGRDIDVRPVYPPASGQGRAG